jgi:hypothetical protein
MRTLQVANCDDSIVHSSECVKLPKTIGNGGYETDRVTMFTREGTNGVAIFLPPTLGAERVEWEIVRAGGQYALIARKVG